MQHEQCIQSNNLEDEMNKNKTETEAEVEKCFCIFLCCVCAFSHFAKMLQEAEADFSVTVACLLRLSAQLICCKGGHKSAEKHELKAIAALPRRNSRFPFFIQHIYFFVSFFKLNTHKFTSGDKML